MSHSMAPLSSFWPWSSKMWGLVFRLRRAYKGGGGGGDINGRHSRTHSQTRTCKQASAHISMCIQTCALSHAVTHLFVVARHKVVVEFQQVAEGSLVLGVHAHLKGRQAQDISFTLMLTFYVRVQTPCSPPPHPFSSLLPCNSSPFRWSPIL
jgi:hypothetical protein